MYASEGGKDNYISQPLGKHVVPYSDNVGLVAGSSFAQFQFVTDDVLRLHCVGSIWADGCQCKRDNWPKPATDTMPRPAFCRMLMVVRIRVRSRDGASPGTVVNGGQCAFFGCITTTISASSPG